MQTRGQGRFPQDDDVSEPLMGGQTTAWLQDETWPTASQDREKKEDKGNAFKLLMSFLAMVFFGLGNKVFQKIMTIPMQNYPFFLNIFTTFIYIPVSFVYIFPMLYFRRFSKEELNVPQRTFIVIGILDGIAGLMQVFAVTKIASGSLLILLISMLISRLFLGTSYKLMQYVGATIVMIGIVTVLYPDLTSHGQKGQDEGATTPGETVLWACVMMLSCVPMALSSVFKEKALSDVDMDAIYLNGFIAVYQFLSCIPAAVPAAIAQGMALEDIPKSIYDGFQCYNGHNTITNSTIPSKNDNCASAPFDVNVYLCFNIMYNLLMIFILKYGSANILFLALTVMVPFGNFAFALPWVPGHQDLTPYDFLGLFVIMTGLVAYRFAGLLLECCKGKKDKIPDI